jgi:molybdate transport system ATP-binding protein
MPVYKRGIGYVFQGAGLLPHLTVRQTLDYATARAPSGPFVRKDVISKTGITALLDQRPSQLSGGEAQRVNIARTLLSQPRLLLLDEPLSALDIDARAVLQTNLQNMLKHAKCHVIYVTHDHAEAQAIADHTIWIANGKLSAPAVSA